MTSNLVFRKQSTLKKLKTSISKKEKYFQTLAQNQVTDLSVSVNYSHIDGLHKNQVNRLLKKEDIVYENNNINSLSILFKKIVDSKNLKVILNSYERYKPVALVEHNVNRIYLFVLREHAERPWIFSGENLKRYSKFDLQIKFWGYVFKTYRWPI